MTNIPARVGAQVSPGRLFRAFPCRVLARSGESVRLKIILVFYIRRNLQRLLFRPRAATEFTHRQAGRALPLFC